MAKSRCQAKQLQKNQKPINQRTIINSKLYQKRVKNTICQLIILELHHMAIITIHCLQLMISCLELSCLSMKKLKMKNKVSSLLNSKWAFQLQLTLNNNTLKKSKPTYNNLLQPLHPAIKIKLKVFICHSIALIKSKIQIITKTSNTN